MTQLKGNSLRKATFIQGTSEFFAAVLPAITCAYHDLYEETTSRDQVYPILSEAQFVPIPVFLTWLVAECLLSVYLIPCSIDHSRDQINKMILGATKKNLGTDILALFAFYIKAPRVYKEQEIQIDLQGDTLVLTYESKTNYAFERTQN